MSAPTLTVEQKWLGTCESFAHATPREWSSNDERTYRLGLELIAKVRAEERQQRDELIAALRELVGAHDGYLYGLGPCICAAHEQARAVLAKVQP